MQNKKVVILHQTVTSSANADELDVLAQVEVVECALKNLGYEIFRLGFSLQLDLVRAELCRINPGFVFNLVESVAGDGSLIALAPSLLDHLGINYSGCTPAALFQTSHKLLAKKIMNQAHLPTPETYFIPNQAYIIKALWEHASLGLDERSVVYPHSEIQLAQMVTEKSRAMGRPCFSERYVHGREFSVPLLQGKILPISEIKFSHADPAQVRVLGYQAKWDPSSPDYQKTIPSYQVNDQDFALYRALSKLAEKAWTLFDLRGYARVDFRVDEGENLWILEVNANPCIAPGSGFFTAACRIYRDFNEVVVALIPTEIAA